VRGAQRRGVQRLQRGGRGFHARRVEARDRQRYGLAHPTARAAMSATASSASLCRRSRPGPGPAGWPRLHRRRGPARWAQRPSSAHCESMPLALLAARCMACPRRCTRRKAPARQRAGPASALYSPSERPATAGRARRRACRAGQRPSRPARRPDQATDVGAVERGGVRAGDRSNAAAQRGLASSCTRRAAGSASAIGAPSVLPGPETGRRFAHQRSPPSPRSGRHRRRTARPAGPRVP
jgi:hypothetical protein